MPIFRDFLTAFNLAFKAKLALVSVGIWLVVALSMALSSYFGARQPATVSLDVGFSAIRILVPLLIVLLVQELFSKEFDRRYYLTSLAYPRSRSCMLLGRLFAVLVCVIGLLLMLGLLQVVFVEFVSEGYEQSTPVGMGWSYFLVIAFLALDLLVLVAVATLLAVVASTPSFVLIGTYGFMLIARSYGAIVELLGRGGGLVADAESYRTSLGVLGYLLPDLGALDIRMLALYGKADFLPSDWPWLLLSNLAYAFAMVVSAILVLQRKRFS